jgi:putative holliday junction resolvase
VNHCGRGEIRTHGALASTTVFKTVALNHSATRPYHAIICKNLLFCNGFTVILCKIMNGDSTKKVGSGRILGIDYGSKRIGVALSDEKRQFAIPLSVVENNHDLFAKIEKIATDNEVKEIVVGESRNYKGEPNMIFLDSMEFKKKMEQSGFTVYLELEFMTSVQAERIQGKNEMSDASAAAIILQSYLDREKDAV